MKCKPIIQMKIKLLRYTVFIQFKSTDIDVISFIPRQSRLEVNLSVLIGFLFFETWRAPYITNYLRIVLEKIGLPSFLYKQNSNLTSSIYFKKLLRCVPLKNHLFSNFSFLLATGILACDKKKQIIYYEEFLFRLGQC